MTEEHELLDRYWRARCEFERVLREIPPALIKLDREGVEQMLADIDPPGLEESDSLSS